MVVGSFDPNDITCLEGETVNPDKIGDYLHYNINFKNVGSVNASIVKITNTINAEDFDINSVQVLNSSHNAAISTGGGELKFIFNDINLALGASGNISFKIKSVATLKEGDSVINKAGIAFNEDASIITSDAVTTFKTVLGMDNYTNPSVSIYPNPAGGLVNINSGSFIKSVTLYDLQGRLLQNADINRNTTIVDISAKASGIYFIKVITDKGSKTEKLIKQ